MPWGWDQLVKLSAEDMETINDLHKKPGMHRGLLVGPGGIPGEAVGWTYEQLGWPMVDGGFVKE